MRAALTSPTLVVAGLRAAIIQELPDLNFVYDPELVWGEAARARRAQYEMLRASPEAIGLPDPGTPPTQFPMMGWRRSALIPMAGRSRRNVFAGGAQPVQANGVSSNWDLRAFTGQIQFEFKLYSRDVIELEALEMGYVTNSLISDIGGFTMPIPSLYPAADLGGMPPDLWHYEVQWDPLNPEITTERRPAVVFALEGSATIRGSFISGAVAQHYPLNTIHLKLEDMNGTLEDEIMVTRTIS